MHFIHDRLSGAKRQRHNEKMIGDNVYDDCTGNNSQTGGAESERLIFSRLVSL